MKKIRLCLVLVGLVLVPASMAQMTLMTWDVNGVSESASSVLGATTVSGVSATAELTRGAGAGLPGSPANNAFGASGFASVSMADALADGDYFSFTISARDGFALSLTEVSYRMSITTNGPTNAALFTNLGGFSAEQAVITYSITTAAGGGDRTVALSGLNDVQGPVEFRIYAWGSGTGTTDKFRFRNLVGADVAISGSISAVPEPSTYATLLGLAALGAVALRRRRAVVQR